jgi:hypothetical protein
MNRSPDARFSVAQRFLIARQFLIFRGRENARGWTNDVQPYLSSSGIFERSGAGAIEAGDIEAGDNVTNGDNL